MLSVPKNTRTNIPCMSVECDFTYFPIVEIKIFLYLDILVKSVKLAGKCDKYLLHPVQHSSNVGCCNNTSVTCHNTLDLIDLEWSPLTG